MGRDIRFRQPLRKKTGEFIEWFYWNIFISPAIQQNGFDTRSQSQQFTGFKDAKGNDIFEGDIIEVICTWGKYKGIIEYGIKDKEGKAHACFGYWIINDDGKPDSFYLSLMDIGDTNLTVVGNIYENTIEEK